MEEINDWKDAINLSVVVKRAKEMQEWNYEDLERVLTEAIFSCAKECLERNNGRIYTTLSGGLDSSFCLAKIRASVGYKVPIHTFTIADRESHPDIQYARMIAKKFKTVHHQFIPSQEERKMTEWYLAKNRKEIYAGDEAVFLVYKFISLFGAKSVIAHDGIDELLGGYWEHRTPKTTSGQRRVFKDFWKRLPKEHLIPLENSANEVGIFVIFPYLQREVVEYISRIPVNKRTSKKSSKMPLREIASKYLPEEVIRREKRGFSNAF